MTQNYSEITLKWFIAEKPGSHFAVEGVEVSIKSSKIRQALMSSGLEARRVENTSFGHIAFCLTSLVRKAGHIEIMLFSSSSVRQLLLKCSTSDLMS